MEADFAKKVIDRLMPHFDCKAEQWSEDGKSRIDFIVTDKVYGKPFGLEFKDFNHKRGVNLGDHLLQSMRYACSKFKVNGKYQHIPVLICPPISYNFLMCPVPESMILSTSAFGDGDREFFHDRHRKDHEHHTVNGMIGSLGVGEIRTQAVKEHRYMRFVFSNKALWEERPYHNSKKPIGLNLKNYEFQMSKEIGFRFL